MRVVGPLDFSLTGVLASLAVPLAEAKVSIFVEITKMLTFASARGTAREARTPVKEKSRGPTTRIKRRPRSAGTSAGTLCSSQTPDSSSGVRRSLHHAHSRQFIRSARDGEKAAAHRPARWGKGICRESADGVTPRKQQELQLVAYHERFTAGSVPGLHPQRGMRR